MAGEAAPEFPGLSRDARGAGERLRAFAGGPMKDNERSDVGVSSTAPD